MRSYFSRIFIPITALLLATIIFVGVCFQVLTRRGLNHEALNTLKDNGQTVARLAAAYYIEGSMTGYDFLINLSVSANVSGVDAVICDEEGRLLLCSESPLGCAHQGMQLSKAFIQETIETGCVADRGEVSGLYEDERYVVAVPVRIGNGQPIGVVVLTKPLSDTVKTLTLLSNTYVYVSVATVLLVLLIMRQIAKRQSALLREMANVATAFGHGNMQARMQINAHAPQEAQDVAVAFNNMATSLERSEYQRQEFVANVSHELKTPMTTIGGYVDGILDGTIPPERQEHYMQIVSDETKRLSRLVRSMLDISRLQEQQGIPEEKKTRFDICECAGQTLLSFEHRITAKELDVQVQMPELPIFTQADKDAVTQVIYNLLDNGVKFCPRGGQLRLQVQENDEKVYVSIGNDGNEIPADELPLVFDRFHKLDKSRNREQEGWGLGLYIVKTLVCSHGEDISVTSRDGVTEFTFTLPVVP